MAGRPRTMVRKIDELEQAAFDVADKLFQLVPEQYLTRDSDEDEFALMWKGAINAANDAWMITHGDSSVRLGAGKRTWGAISAERPG